MLTADQTSIVDDWVREMYSEGRVPGIRIPPQAATLLVPAGQLGSRLAVANPSLGAGYRQWDYQPAPEAVRILDNAGAIEDELTTALVAYSDDLTSFLTEVAKLPGEVVSGIVHDAILPGVGAFIPSWVWYGLGGVAALSLWVLFSDSRASDRVARAAGRAGSIARAAVL